jgi:amino-acid N-acetyltransferase
MFAGNADIDKQLRTTMTKYKFRKPVIADAPAITGLINHFAEKRIMLPRAVADVWERIRDFTICELKGRVIGCVALHVLWEDMVEIRSLAVIESAQKRGVGHKLVEACLRDARLLGIPRVLALTYEPDFFKRFGFRECEKETLPRKVWKDCIYCPLFPKCGETALVLDLKTMPAKSRSR